MPKPIREQSPGYHPDEDEFTLRLLKPFRPENKFVALNLDRPRHVDDVSEVLPQLLGEAILPGTALILATSDGNTTYEFIAMVAITPFLDRAVRIAFRGEGDYRLEMNVFSKYFIEKVLQGTHPAAVALGRNRPVIDFDLQSRNGQTRLPGFRAKPFVKRVIDFYRKPIVITHWEPGSDNWYQYSNSLLQGSSSSIAASGTWTGRTLARFGYRLEAVTEAPAASRVKRIIGYNHTSFFAVFVPF